MSFAVISFAVSLFLSSCGGDTRGWPHIEFDFGSQDVSKATIYYQINKSEYIDYLEDVLIFNNQTEFEELLSDIKGYPIKKEKESSIETSTYFSKTIINFTLVDSYADNIERLIFYSYGVGSSKVMLNNGDVHFVPGRVDYIYEDMKASYQKI